MKEFPGGKGLNQSLSIARAGGKVIHAGAIGRDGTKLRDLLLQANVNVSKLQEIDSPSGHAIIQLQEDGQNSIIVCGGANSCLSIEYIADVLNDASPDDFVLLQNETNNIDAIINIAQQKGLRIIWNPSPFPDVIDNYPADKVFLFILNEIEASQLINAKQPIDRDEIIPMLKHKLPNSNFVVTLGEQGAYSHIDGKTDFYPAFAVQAVDTTGAGDTFCGYFIASLCKGLSSAIALKMASAAAALSVTKHGAAPSIPLLDEVEAFLSQKVGSDQL